MKKLNQLNTIIQKIVIMKKLLRPCGGCRNNCLLLKPKCAHGVEKAECYKRK